MIREERPNRLYTESWSSSSFVVPIALVVFVQAQNITPSWSAKTMIESYGLDGGKSVMKSMEQVSNRSASFFADIGISHGAIGCVLIFVCLINLRVPNLPGCSIGLRL